MKTFSAVAVVRQPRALLYATVRDRLTELADRVDDVASIVELEREELHDDAVRIVNEWRSSQHIPDLLANALGTTEIGWIDRNRWDGSTGSCAWSTEPFVLTEHITCRGLTTYETAMGGRGTKVTVTGEFDLARGALGRLAALERPVAGFVETIVTTMIPKNTRKVIEAAADLIAAEAR